MTAMDAPAGERARGERRLRAVAADVVHPDRARALAVGRAARPRVRARAVELPAHDVRVELPQSKRRPPPDFYPRCMFYNTTRDRWSDRGLELLETTEKAAPDSVVCESSHLTLTHVEWPTFVFNSKTCGCWGNANAFGDLLVTNLTIPFRPDIELIRGARKRPKCIGNHMCRHVYKTPGFTGGQGLRKRRLGCSLGGG